MFYSSLTEKVYYRNINIAIRKYILFNIKWCYHIARSINPRETLIKGLEMQLQESKLKCTSKVPIQVYIQKILSFVNNWQTSFG